MDIEPTQALPLSDYEEETDDEEDKSKEKLPVSELRLEGGILRNAKWWEIHECRVAHCQKIHYVQAWTQVYCGPLFEN